MLCIATVIAHNVLFWWCISAIFIYGKFFAHPVFCHEVIQGGGPIFSKYWPPVVIITTNQLVANFVWVHLYFYLTTSLMEFMYEATGEGFAHGPLWRSDNVGCLQ